MSQNRPSSILKQLYFKLPNKLLSLHLRDSQVVIYAMIAAQAESFDISISELAKRLRKSRNTVRKDVLFLEKNGFFDVRPYKGSYQITFKYDWDKEALEDPKRSRGDHDGGHKQDQQQRIIQDDCPSTDWEVVDHDKDEDGDPGEGGEGDV